MYVIYILYVCMIYFVHMLSFFLSYFLVFHWKERFLCWNKHITFFKQIVHTYVRHKIRNLVELWISNFKFYYAMKIEILKTLYVRQRFHIFLICKKIFQIYIYSKIQKIMIQIIEIYYCLVPYQYHTVFTKNRNNKFLR